jgi:putative tricarboxylic transport membrane protein
VPFLDALSLACSPETLLLVCLGVLFGLIFGAIPGLTATLAVVILIPITYGLDAVSGIAMLIGVYIGGISGGCVSAILIGMPGTPSSITTTFDGFPLAKQGLGGKAMGAAITSNAFGSLFSGLALAALAPQIAKFALQFGAFEYVAVIIFGLTAVISLSGDSLLKGFITTAFGLMLCTIGLDPIDGTLRNTFGLEFLTGGITAIPALIGLFVVSQVFKELETITEKYLVPKDRSKNVLLNWQELKKSAGNIVRSGTVGTLIGILPGIGGSLANFVAYDLQKKADPDPESYGKGNIQGIIASEVSNNAVVGGALVPLLALGIPGDSVTAALMGGLQLHGLDPGPLLFTEHLSFVYALFIDYVIAVAAMFFIMWLAGSRIFPIALRMPKTYLLPIVLIASVVGCYNLGYSSQDMWVALAFGVIGYFFNQYQYPSAPLVISLVLGRILEKQMRTGLIQSSGSILPMFTSPIALVFLLLALVSLGYSLRMIWQRRQNKSALGS